MSVTLTLMGPDGLPRASVNMGQVSDPAAPGQPQSADHADALALAAELLRPRPARARAGCGADAAPRGMILL